MSFPRRSSALAAGVVVASVSLALPGPAHAASAPTTTKPASSIISTPAAITAGITAPAAQGANTAMNNIPAAPVLETTVAAVKDGRWKAQVTVYKSPDGPVLTKLTNGTNIKGRAVFTVVEKEGEWLKVNVPARPNGTTGYVRAADVTTFTHTFSMIVELGNRRVLVYQGDKLVHTEKVAVGKPKTPTPTGRFFTVDLLRPKKGATGPYGPYAYGLSGFSTVYQTFGGGDGRLGIHGTNEPAKLGGAVTNGCIRLSNAGITKLRNVLPLGVPVDIRP